MFFFYLWFSAYFPQLTQDVHCRARAHRHIKGSVFYREVKGLLQGKIRPLLYKFIWRHMPFFFLFQILYKSGRKKMMAYSIVLILKQNISIHLALTALACGSTLGSCTAHKTNFYLNGCSYNLQYIPISHNININNC